MMPLMMDDGMMQEEDGAMLQPPPPPPPPPQYVFNFTTVAPPPPQYPPEYLEFLRLKYQQKQARQGVQSLLAPVHQRQREDHSSNQG